MITTNVPILKIHKLAQAQYDRELANGNIDENALYLTPDEGNSAGSYIIPINGNLEFDSSFSFSWEELLTAIDNKYYVAIRQNSEDFYGREFILSCDLRDDGEIKFTYSHYKIIYTLTLSSTGTMQLSTQFLETSKTLKSANQPADAKAVGDALATKAPLYTYGTEDLVAGESELATGTLYFVYEEEE